MFFSLKVLKAKKEAGTNFVSVEKYGWTIQKSSFAWNNQGSTFFNTHENLKMFNITSKYFSFFNNKPPKSWFAHITKDLLTHYFCSYYSSMVYPLYSCAVITNVAKKFFQLLDLHFLPSKKFHKILNTNNVKASYCCTQSVWNIKSHNKKLINSSNRHVQPCNSRKEKKIVH